MGIVGANCARLGLAAAPIDKIKNKIQNISIKNKKKYYLLLLKLIILLKKKEEEEKNKMEPEKVRIDIKHTERILQAAMDKHGIKLEKILWAEAGITSTSSSSHGMTLFCAAYLLSHPDSTIYYISSTGDLSQMCWNG